MTSFVNFWRHKINLVKEKNRFKEMGFIKFWIFSTLFFITFPLSLIFCLLFLGTKQTKQFIVVLINDYFQTILIIFIIIIIVIIFLFNYLSNFFS